MDARRAEIIDAVTPEPEVPVLPNEGPMGHWLSDPHHVRDDCKMIARAARERWPMADEKRIALVDRLLKMADISPKERHVLSAARALIAMDRDNVAAETGHKGPIAATQVNVNVGTNPIDDMRARIEASKPIQPSGTQTEQGE